jgi:hypothetical protein
MCIGNPNPEPIEKIVEKDIKDIKIESLLLLNHVANGLCEQLIDAAESREAYIAELEGKIHEYEHGTRH